MKTRAFMGKKVCGLKAYVHWDIELKKFSQKSKNSNSKSHFFRNLWVSKNDNTSCGQVSSWSIRSGKNGYMAAGIHKK